MADNRVQQIAEAILDKLDGLTTTSTNAYVHKATEHEPSKLPAINITLGEVAKVAEDLSTQDLEMEVNITAVSAVNSGYWEQLLLIQKEVHTALRADYTVGLASIVHDTKYEGSNPIAVSGEGSSVVATLDMAWTIHFRTSVNDISS